MNKEDEIIHVEMNEEDVQNLVNCYEKDIKYIKKLEQELERYKNIVDRTIKILKNIYMLDNVSITNNAVEQIDKAINLLEVENESKM